MQCREKETGVDYARSQALGTERRLPKPSSISR